MGSSCGDGDKAAVRRWDIALASPVISPGDYRSIGLKAHTVVISCANGDKAIAKVHPDDLFSPTYNRGGRSRIRDKERKNTNSRQRQLNFELSTKPKVHCFLL